MFNDKIYWILIYCSHNQHVLSFLSLIFFILNASFPDTIMLNLLLNDTISLYDCFHVSTLCFCLSYKFKSDFCKQKIKFCFLVYSAFLCLLIRELNPLTFWKITDMKEFSEIFLWGFTLFLQFDICILQEVIHYFLQRWLGWNKCQYLLFEISFIPSLSDWQLYRVGDSWLNGFFQFFICNILFPSWFHILFERLYVIFIIFLLS